MKEVTRCIMCNCGTKYIAKMSGKNEWLFKKKEVPMCIDCFYDLLNHKYYTFEKDDCSTIELMKG